MNIDILVNKNNPIGYYVPNNLVITDNNENNFHDFLEPTLKPTIDAYVYKEFLLMQKEALKDGFKIMVDYGYRSFEYQQKLYDFFEKEKGSEYTKKYVAIPGTSEHQTGLAMDIGFYKNGVFSDEITKEEPVYKWLVNNSYKFGFILRYPFGKENETGYDSQTVAL